MIKDARIHFLYVLLFVALWTASAQTSGEGRLTVHSSPGGAEVFVGRSLVGVTPLERVGVPAGRVVLRIVYPSGRSWNAIERIDTMEIQPGQEILRDVDLGAVFSLNSIPSGATVFHRSQEVGMTPLFWSGSTIVGELRLKKEGYEEVSVDIPLPAIFVRLKPISPQHPSEVLSSDLTNGSNNRTSVYIAAGALIVSGVIAAYLKDQADREFDAYIKTALPHHRQATRRLDRQSGISFIVTQISFGALAYFLLTD